MNSALWVNSLRYGVPHSLLLLGNSSTPRVDMVACFGPTKQVHGLKCSRDAVARSRKSKRGPNAWIGTSTKSMPRVRLSRRVGSR